MTTTTRSEMVEAGGGAVAAPSSLDDCLSCTTAGTLSIGVQLGIWVDTLLQSCGVSPTATFTCSQLSGLPAAISSGTLLVSSAARKQPG